MPLWLHPCFHVQYARFRYHSGMTKSHATPRFLLIALIFSMLAAACFLPGLGGGFIFDDRPNIQENGALHLTELSLDTIAQAAYSFQPGHGSRPLSMLSFALDYWRGGGLNPRVFKITNIAIHALTAYALAVFFRLLLLMAGWSANRAAVAAIFLAMLWAIHPLQVSAVLYVVQRMQTLGTLFLVLSLWAYLKGRHAQLQNASGRTFFALTGLFWLLAFAAKEDSALLPAYLFMLELTVLRFQAAKASSALMLRRGYLAAVGLGLCVYLFVVVPHFWSWGDYAGRQFSTTDRLLTQGRVLVMYIGQILLPLPDRLVFYYDTLRISRGLMDPPATLLSWAVVAALLAWAWRARTRRPVFSFGVLLFFAGHFVTSNVIGLEMAFEHRNHFPLVGAVLALGDLARTVWQQLRGPRWIAMVLAAGVFTAAAAATLVRSHEWGEPLRFERYSVQMAPDSVRAWLALGEAYAGLAGLQSGSPYLQQAIDTLNQAAERIDSPLILANIVNYRTIQGTVTSRDWDRFLQKLRQAPMTVQNRNLFWVMIRNARRGIEMDEAGMTEMLEIVSTRAALDYRDFLQIGAYFFSNTSDPDRAFSYLALAVEKAPADAPLIDDMLVQIERAGYAEWSQTLRRLRQQAN